MYEISVPLSIRISDKKKFSLNLNEYRNAHYFILNKAKVMFKEQVTKLVQVLPKMEQVEITYRVFFGSNRLADCMNVCSIVDKFFCDALVELGKLEDDNYNFIQNVNIRFGGIDKTNPRVEITLEPTEIVSKKDEQMQITIVQTEIEQAIRDYIASQITINEGQKIEIDLSATRGAEGFKATIDIVNGAAVKKVAAPVAKAPVVQQEAAATEETTASEETQAAEETQAEQSDESVPSFLKTGAKSIFGQANANA